MVCKTFCFLFLLIPLLDTVYAWDKEDYVCNTFYSQLADPLKRVKLTTDQLKDYLPVDFLGNYKNTTNCAEGEYNDFCYFFHDWFYCYKLPKFYEWKNRERVSMVDKHRRLRVCNTTTDCNGFAKLSGCDVEIKLTITGGRGLCVKIEPFSYLLSLMVDRLPATATLEQKKQYLPVNEGSDQDCFTEDNKCANGMFCDYLHRYPQDEHTTNGKCFQIPKLPVSNQQGPRIAIVVSKSKRLLPCTEDLDCYCTECDSQELSICDKTTNMQFRAATTKIVHDGICVKAHPVAFTFSRVFRLPEDAATYAERRKYFPVDYKGPDQNLNDLKQCTVNKDCEPGQFCDTILNMKTGTTPKAGKSHCFTIPNDQMFSENTKVLTLPDKTGLILCDVASDCPFDSFCNSLSGKTYVEWNSTVNRRSVRKGYCMKAGKCAANEHSGTWMEFGTSPSDLKISCESDRDCIGTRDTNGTYFESRCALKHAIQNVNLCCHRRIPLCKYGIVFMSGERCEQNESKEGGFAECNLGLEKMRKQDYKSTAWCDESSHRCCHGGYESTLQFCPDGQTPLFNEPKCEKYDESESNSGECVHQVGAVCKLGHCCPSTRLDSNGKLERGQLSYITNHPCEIGIRPPEFPSEFCSGEGFVVVRGKLSPLHEDYRQTGFWSGKKCHDDEDCATDNSSICIHDDDWNAYCYFNPMRPLPINWPIIILVGGLVTSVLFIVGISVVIIIRKRKKKRVVKPELVCNRTSPHTTTLTVTNNLDVYHESGGRSTNKIH